ncbi:tryptophan--tRNA ligase [Friedmanniomyces endolithicus]|nr:tryptophan--tRNA ligase [Friedmanniomyces endolithicus]
MATLLIDGGLVDEGGAAQGNERSRCIKISSGDHTSDAEKETGHVSKDRTRRLFVSRAEDSAGRDVGRNTMSPMATAEPVGAPPAVKSDIEDKKASQQQIDPYNVAGEVDEHGNVKAIDYDRLIHEFGVQPLTEEHLRRFEAVTGKKAHRLMRRKLFFSHRDFDKILDAYEQHGTFMLYTGRGPSSGSMHLGHTVPIFMSDTPGQIKNKINKHAFSGGRESLEEHRKLGGNPDVDVAYTYLSYFLDDDEELEELAKRYRSGELLTGEMKQRCIAELQKFVTEFQERRKKVTDEVMREYMRPRKLEFGGNPSPKQSKGPANGAGEASNGGSGDGEKAARDDGRGTKGERKAAKMAEKKAQKLSQRPKGAEEGVDGT